MKKKLPKKMLNICILKVLKEYTDAKHRLYQNDIIKIIEKKYGLSCERKAVSRNIDALRDFGYDIQISKGYYFAEKKLEEEDLKLIICSLLSCKHINNKCCKEIIKKLEIVSGSKVEFPFNFIKLSEKKELLKSERFIDVLEVITQALNYNRKVLLRYDDSSSSDNQKTIGWNLTSPKKILPDNGRLYIVCREENGKIIMYMIDNICHAMLSKQSAI